MRNISLEGAFYTFGNVDSWEECEDGSVSVAILRKGQLVIEWEEDGLSMLAELTSGDHYYFEGPIRDPRFRHSVGEMNGHLYQSTFGDYAFWMEMHYDDTGYGGHYMIHLDPKTNR